jgi:hypothetical protein
VIDSAGNRATENRTFPTVKKRLTSFTLLLPIMEMGFSAVLVAVPALLLFSRLRHAAGGSQSAALAVGQFQVVVPSHEFLIFSVEMACLSAEKWITVVNAPAKFIESVLSLMLFQTTNWTPTSILTFCWHDLIYPIYAIPAWIYVGRVVDALLKRDQVRRGNAIASLVLAILSGLLFSLIRFGLSSSDRQDEHLSWLISGFALWAALFAVPSVVWLSQRARKTSRKHGLQIS